MARTKIRILLDPDPEDIVPGVWVQITSGPFAYHDARVRFIEGDMIRAEVNFFDRPTPVDIPKNYVIPSYKLEKPYDPTEGKKYVEIALERLEEEEVRKADVWKVEGKDAAIIRVWIWLKGWVDLESLTKSKIPYESCINVTVIKVPLLMIRSRVFLRVNDPRNGNIPLFREWKQTTPKFLHDSYRVYRGKLYQPEDFCRFILNPVNSKLYKKFKRGRIIPISTKFKNLRGVKNDEYGYGYLHCPLVPRSCTLGIRARDWGLFQT